MTIISRHTKVQNIISVYDPIKRFWFSHAHDLLPVFCVFWTEFGQITLTCRVGISRSFETCIKIALSFLLSI